MSPRAFALNPSVDINQYAHTAWTVSEGFFKSISRSIVQTADGYLWLGTEFGLVRFDGVRAVPWTPPGPERLPSDQIPRLLAARDGTLWIGTSTCTRLFKTRSTESVAKPCETLSDMLARSASKRKFSEQLLRSQIRDDGVGITPEILEGGRSNRFGFHGMRERAEQIGGKIDIWSAAGAGTEIDLSVGWRN